MTKFRIHQTLTYYEVFEVDAETREEALQLHKRGESMKVGLDYSDAEIVDGPFPVPAACDA